MGGVCIAIFGLSRFVCMRFFAGSQFDRSLISWTLTFHKAFALCTLLEIARASISSNRTFLLLSTLLNAVTKTHAVVRAPVISASFSVPATENAERLANDRVLRASGHGAVIAVEPGLEAEVIGMFDWSSECRVSYDSQDPKEGRDEGEAGHDTSPIGSSAGKTKITGLRKSIWVSNLKAWRL